MKEIEKFVKEDLGENTERFKSGEIYEEDE